MKIKLKPTLTLAAAIAAVTLSGCATIKDVKNSVVDTIKEVSSPAAEPGIFYAYNENAVRMLNGIAGDKARSTCGGGLFEHCKNYASPAIIKDGQVLSAVESSSKSIIYSAKAGATNYATTIRFMTRASDVMLELKVAAIPANFQFDGGRIKGVNIAGDINFTVYRGDGGSKTKPFANFTYFNRVDDIIKQSGQFDLEEWKKKKWAIIENHRTNDGGLRAQTIRNELGSGVKLSGIISTTTADTSGGDPKNLLKLDSTYQGSEPLAKLTTVATIADFYGSPSKNSGAYGYISEELTDDKAPGMYAGLKVGDLIKVTNGPWLKLVENGLKVCSTRAICGEPTASGSAVALSAEAAKELQKASVEAIPAEFTVKEEAGSFYATHTAVAATTAEALNKVQHGKSHKGLTFAADEVVTSMSDDIRNNASKLSGEYKNLGCQKVLDVVYKAVKKEGDNYRAYQVVKFNETPNCLTYERVKQGERVKMPVGTAAEIAALKAEYAARHKQQIEEIKRAHAKLLSQ